MHPHAEPAAEAAEAAGAQGQCWAMHEMLFENQQQLAAPYLLAYAKALGLDLARSAARSPSTSTTPRSARTS
jgi:protein-disulfide isomerase